MTATTLRQPLSGVSDAARRRTPRRRRPARLEPILRHCVLLFGALTCLFPFYWMYILATHDDSAMFARPPELVPGDQFGTNFAMVNDQVNIWGAMTNTFIVATLVTASVLFFDALAAFTFAKYDFPGRNLLFTLILATFLVPSELSTIPQFLIMVNIGWVGQLQAVIVPSMVNAFGIFWLRQYMANSVPKELLEAALMDGGGFLRQFWHVALPMSRSALAFLGMFTFIGAWNAFMWPLIVLTNPEMVTLQVALSHLQISDYGTPYAAIMTCSIISVTPLLLVFILGAKQFLVGISEGALQ